MKAPISDQRALLEVAQLDQQLSSLAHRESTLPEIVTLRETSLKANTARDLRIAAETELNDVNRELKRAEGDVEQIVTRIERDEKRLASGQGSAKDLEHMQHELVTLAARRAELEEAELEVMMRVDTIKVRIETLKNEEAQYAAQISELEEKKASALGSIETERAALSATRMSQAAAINPELLALYSKIAADNFGNGAAALVGNQCKGCNLAINTVEVQRISALDPEEIVRCEQCRCILVRA